MATSQQKNKFVQKTIDLAKMLVDHYGDLIINDAEWSGTMQTAIIQDDLDANSSYGGLTTQQLGDATFALATVKNEIANALQQLLKLADLSD